MASTLSNSNAYGFALNVVSKVILTTLTNGKITKFNPPKNSRNNFKPVEVKIGQRKIHCLAFSALNGNVVSLSQYHMMCASQLGLIYNGAVYIINGDKLRLNWNKHMLYSKRYTDGCGLLSIMSYMSIDSLVGIADKAYSVEPNLYAWYQDKEKEYFGNK